MASLLQKQVYQAYLNAGLSPNQARIITAEVGREGSFNPKNLFGVHIDPKNGATNLGMLSWQGNRGQALYAALKAQGLIRGNGIAPTQDALNMMARFSIDEMRNKKEYRQTAQTFLNNPDVDYQTGAAVLGRNFIRWRYDDPVYKSGHANRDKFYQAMGGVVGQHQQEYKPEYVPQNLLQASNNTYKPEYVQKGNITQQQYQPEYVPEQLLGG
ncbi:phage tail tip lysozyme [Acinetobacter bereziniae]|uniref:phage tail tip lysozyme n=1 Tax=Acinetobacter bereziniae TaxID=106648 RepID=UPI001116A42C|nr:phage tail tip lysozyme [Acinetobacter bereziniae]TNL51194.1 hypothetical protein EYB59_08715 [Acinetobacter bereziniae]TNL58438.1 hypothetical protein EYY58_11540 [Acinetobacter bereziniae]